MTSTPPVGIKELRLAMVCYGGVSLAVYMHGITKEVQQLLLASRAAETGTPDGPAPDSGPSGAARQAYVDALRRRSQRDQAQVRVVVDVLSGTSAGGIDAVYLGKAIARDTSQQPLLDLWLDKGDLAGLLRGRGPLKVKLGWFLLRAALSRGRVTPPVKGDELARWLYDALAQMEEQRTDGAGTLVPVGQSLDLFVTITDSRGYRRFVSVMPGDPTIHDQTHRHVLHFHHRRPGADPGTGQFGPEHAGALAFAARTTSSFPGAFPPVSLTQFHRALRSRPMDVEAFARTFFAEYTAWGDSPRSSWFVDGGVLDNYPFGHALAAIDRKAADCEVERHLLFVEPDPKAPSAAGTASPQEVEMPTWLQTIIAARSSIPAHEPILDELVSLRARNERVAQLAELGTDRMGDIYKRLDQHAPGWREGTLGYAEIHAATMELHDRAHEELGVGLPAYLRLRRQSVAVEISRAVAEAFGYPETSSHAAFAREVCRSWLSERYVDTDANTSGFLRRLDLPFRERRMRFVVQGVNAFYGDPQGPSRAELDAAKSTLYEALQRLWYLPQQMSQQMRGAVTGLFDQESLITWVDRDPKEFIAEHRDRLVAFEQDLGGWVEDALGDAAAVTWDALQQATGSWPAAARAELLARYVGFPLWDVAVLPVTGVSGVQQVSPVRVRRISPLDAVALGWEGEKLKGVGLHHFAAFLKRESRENDYLWGRLDGLELFLRLVDPEIDDAALAAAFRAVLDEEANLTGLNQGGNDSVRNKLRASVDVLAAR